MSKITLVTGGSRSGKSTFGENLYKGIDDVLYVATAIVTDEEMAHRIQRHKDSRNQKWNTLEGYENLHEKISNYDEKHIFLDCVTIMTTNLMFDKYWDYDKVSDEEVDRVCTYIKEQFTMLINTCRNLNKELVLITNEVGWGLVPESRLSRVFRDMQGFINQHVGALSDEVYLVCCGCAVKMKG